MAYGRSRCYTRHMKRTNLVLDENKLDEAKTVSGSRTYSETVNLALEEYIRRHTFAQIDTFAGTDVWEGDLSVMREDTGDSVSR
jgi:Arc/MetJ family transcription regulator